MKLLELIWNLEDAYHRFGDIDVSIDGNNKIFKIKETFTESEEFIIKCE